MLTRVAIVAGLLAGAAAAALVLGGIIILGPEPVASPTPAPTVVPSAIPSAAPASAPAPAASGAAGGEASEFGIGRPAPALAVPQVGGGTIDLAALRGRPVWVTFMGTWCPSCVDEFPIMNRFAARHEDDGLVVLAIDVEEEEGLVASFAARLGAIFPMGLDGDGSVAERWNAEPLPVHFWIDRDGIIRHGALGGIGADVMAQGLRAIMPGVVVDS